MSVDNEQHEDISESRYMMMNKQQPETAIETSVPKHLSKRNPRRSHIPYTVLLLLFIVGSSIVGLVSYQVGKNSNTKIPKEQSDTIVSPDRIENDKTEMDYDVSEKGIPQQRIESNDEQLPQLRSYTGNDQPKSPERIGQMNIYIDKDGRRGSSRNNQRYRFPAARYNRRRLPFYGPFMHFMPRVPIFADQRTKQTLIYSQTGGIYILPPVINLYGQLFSVAELIASGYASLVSSGVPPPTGSINMIPFFQPQPLIGPNIPVINPRTGVFSGGIRTNLGSLSISARYTLRDNIDADFETEEEDGDDGYNNDNYQQQSNSNQYYKRPSNKLKNTRPVRTKTTSATTSATAVTTITPPIPCTSKSCKLSTTVIGAIGTIYYVTTYGGSFYITGNTSVNTATTGATTLPTTCAGYCAYAYSNFGIANTCGLSTISDGTNCIDSAGTISVGSASAVSAIGPGSGDPIPVIFAGVPPGHIFNVPATHTSNACIDNPGYYCCCDTSSG